MFKRKCVPLVLVFAILMLMLQPICCIGAFAETTPTVWDGSIAETYAGGDGTEGNPYLISTPAQLAKILNTDVGSGSAGKFYKLTNDIVLNDTSADNWTESARNWYTSTTTWLEWSFQGTFDGNGHVISGLYIENGEDNRAGGLFPVLRGNVTIKNLGIANSSVTLSGADTFAGAIAGATDGNFTIEKCFVASTVEISATGHVAGMIGKVDNGSESKVLNINNAYSIANLSGTTNTYGLFGYLWRNYTGTVSNVYTIGYDVFANDSGAFIETENEYSDVLVHNWFTHTWLEDKSNMIGVYATDNMDFDYENVWAIKGSKYPYLRKFDEKYADGLYTGVPGEVWDGTIAECYDDGQGTEADPYIIATAPELAKLINDFETDGKFYKLSADIFLNDNTTSNGWQTSSTWLEYHFSGTFDGNGHVVSGLKIDNVSENRVGGLFPSLTGNATVKNLGIVNSQVVFTGAGSYAGAIAGAADANFVIENCFVASTVYVSASEHVAGMIGKVDSGSAKTLKIENAYSMAQLGGGKADGSLYHRYGLFGYMWRNYTGTVNNVYTTDYDLFSNNNGSPIQCTNAYSNVKERSWHAHSNLWHKEYMLGNEAKNVYMTSFDYGVVWDVKDNHYPYLRIFGDKYADGVYVGTPGEPWDGRIAEAYDGGSGTYDSPYLISTAAQLAKLVGSDVNDTLDKYYKLTQDIILNDTSVENWQNTARQWYTSSIYMEYHFEGHFDGNGHTVSGLYINNSDDNRMGGLFQSFGSSATIKNLGIVNSQITFTGATTFAGAIAGGTNGNVNISQCFVDADVSVSATAHVAGFIGKVDSDTAGKVINIDNAYSLATLSGTNNTYGLFGFMWRNYTGNVKNVYTFDYDLFPNDTGVNVKTVNEYSNVKINNSNKHTCLWHKEYMTGFEALKYLNFDWDIWVIKPDKTPYLRIFTNETSLYGDINCDNSVNIKDLVGLKKYFANISTNYDTTNDIIRKNSSDASTLTLMRKYLLNNSWESVNLTPENTAISGYTYVWGDEFNGTGLDTTAWNLENSNAENINTNESTDCLKVNNGTLTLSAHRKQGDTVTYDAAPWIQSNEGMNFKYGYVEMRAKIPFAIGAFPSFWLSTISGAGKDSYESLLKGENIEYSGEVDIFEYFGLGDKKLYTNMHKWYTGSDHAQNSYRGEQYVSSKYHNDYHIIGFEWTETYMKMYFDGVCYATYDITDAGNFDAEGHNTDMSSFHDPAYLRIGNIFNVAKDSNTTDVTTEYSIDWIRLYQKDGSLLSYK